MSGHLTLLVCLLCCMAACAPLRSTFVMLENMPPQQDMRRRIADPCNQWQSYLPDPQHPEYQPMRYLRVNFHVLNSADSAHNFKPDSARVYLTEMLRLANAALDTNIRNWRSPQGTAVLPKGYRYVLYAQPGDDGFYFHYDDDLYYLVYKGKNQNNHKRAVIDKYGVGLDSIINIFVQAHHPDSLVSKTYGATAQGIALGKDLKMCGLFDGNNNIRENAGLLNHEVGHILTLAHAWGGDGCDDTDPHPNNCWVWSKNPPCRDEASNNLMDYNAYKIAMTPCQIGKVHQVFANEKSRIRPCLAPMWCERGADVVVRDSVHWTGARELTGNLVLIPGARVRVSCRLSIPSGGRIVVSPGATLWLDETAYLHNACGETWQGIEVQSKGKLKGLLVREGK